jgi:hypothetical protein
MDKHRIDKVLAARVPEQSPENDEKGNDDAAEVPR